MNARSSLIFIVDSDALIALLHEEDMLFERATKILRQLAAHDAQLIYPLTALMESVSTLTRKLNQPFLAKKIIESAKNDELFIEAIDDKLFSETLHLFQPTASKKNTIFDACVAATAKKLNTKYIFSFDKWYEQLGFTLAESLIK